MATLESTQQMAQIVTAPGLLPSCFFDSQQQLSGNRAWQGSTTWLGMRSCGGGPTDRSACITCRSARRPRSPSTGWAISTVSAAVPLRLLASLFLNMLRSAWPPPHRQGREESWPVRGGQGPVHDAEHRRHDLARHGPAHVVRLRTCSSSLCAFFRSLE